MNGLSNIIVGIFFAILAACMFTIGVIMQKKYVQDLPEIKISDLRTMFPMLKNKGWVIGVIIGTAGGAPYIASQYFIGIGNTQLLLATGLILLAILANKALHEKFGAYEYAGISTVIIGVIFLGLAQLSDVKVTLSTPNFLMNTVIFYSIFGSLIGISLLIYNFTKWDPGKNMALNSGIWFGVGAVSSQIGNLGLDAWNLWVIFLGFGMLIVGNAIGTVIVNIAFQKGKAIIVIPLQSAGNYLIPVFAGLILFTQEFGNAIFFWLSVAFIMVGVILLARIQAEIEKSPPKQDSETKIE